MDILPALQNLLNGLGYHVDAAQFIVLFSLGLTRLLTAITLSPFLGGGSIPGQVKVGLAAVITAILFPHLVPVDGAKGISVLLFFALLLKEAMIGATIGYICQLVFYSVQMAGTLIDTQRGMNQMTFFAPQLPGNTSALGNLQFQAALVIFLAIDGHLIFLRVLARTFQALPLLGLPHFHAGLVPMMEQMARISATALLVAAQLSAPILLALFLVDVAFGTLAKAAPQINVHTESQPIKSLVGLMVVFFAAAFLLGQLKGYFAEMIRQISEITRWFT